MAIPKLIRSPPPSGAALSVRGLRGRARAVRLTGLVPTHGSAMACLLAGVCAVALALGLAGEAADGRATLLAIPGAVLCVALAVAQGRPRAPAAANETTHASPALGALALDLAAVVIRTPGGEIRYWSPGAERLFGYTASQAVGQAAHELLRTRYPRGGRRAADAEITRTGHWHGELRHRRQDGSIVTVAATWELRRVGAAEEALVVESSTEATALKATEEELRALEGRLRLAQEIAEIGTWEWHPDGEEQDWSREQHALFGTDPDAAVPTNVERLVALAHPQDRPALRAGLARAVETGDYEVEFRIRRRGRDGGEETRWIIGRGRRMPGPAGGRGAMLGMHLDITSRKQAEMRQLLLIREVDHRAKNALAVVQAVLRLTRAPDQPSFVKAVEGRVAALARAQTLLTDSNWSAVGLRALLDGELAPFLAAGVAGPAVTLVGPPVLLAPLITQPLSMTVHELATNAMKHGALSVPGGQVHVAWEVEEEEGRRLVLTWAESGGPPVAGAPGRLGFGTRVLTTTVRDQLGGTIELDWVSYGLRCRLRIPLPDPAPGPAAAKE